MERNARVVVGSDPRLLAEPLPSSHTWRLPSLAPSKQLAHSLSMPAHLRAHMPDEDVQSRHQPPFHSTILRCELKLREALQTTPSWPPCRQRGEACLDALRAMSTVPSCFIDLMPTLTRELNRLLLSDYDGPSSSAEGQFNFETVLELRSDLHDMQCKVSELEERIVHERQTAQQRDQAAGTAERKAALFLTALTEAQELRAKHAALELGQKTREDDLHATIEELTATVARLEDRAQQYIDLLHDAKSERDTLAQRAQDQEGFMKELQDRADEKLEAASAECRTLREALITAHRAAANLPPLRASALASAIATHVDEALRWAVERSEVDSVTPKHKRKNSASKVSGTGSLAPSGSASSLASGPPAAAPATAAPRSALGTSAGALSEGEGQ